MKKLYQMKFRFLFPLLTLFVLLACSKDESSDSPDEVLFNFDAVGTIAEQTVEQARATINGRWNVGDSPSSSRRTIDCAFYGIEFTDDRFAIAFQIEGVDPETGVAVDETVFAYGPYTLVENSAGNVTSVDLFEIIDGAEVKIAALTNVVVEESNGELNATFDVEFNLPDDFTDFPCGNLSGNYSAEKDEPLVSEDDSNANSNFALLVGGPWALNQIEVNGEILNFAEAFVGDDVCEEISEELSASAQAQADAELEAINATYASQNEELAIFADQITDLTAEIAALETQYTEQYAAALAAGADEQELAQIRTVTDAQVLEITQAVLSLQTQAETLSAQINSQYEEALIGFEIRVSEIIEEVSQEIDRLCQEAQSDLADAQMDLEVSFSAYGSYIFSVSDESGETVDVEVNEWEFTNASQNELLVDGETRLVIERLTATEFVVIETYTELDEDSGESEEFVVRFSFTRRN